MSALRTIVLAFAVLGAAPHAFAQPKPADPGEVAYQEGRRLYDLREWDPAIAKFKEAYKLRFDQASLFNIAQSYRLKGDCVEATNFYKTYRRNFPKEKAADKAKKFIAELEKCAKDQAAAAKIEPTKTEPTKTEPTKIEPTKVEPTKIEPTKIEPTKIEPTKTEPIKTEPIKTEPIKTEPIKQPPIDPGPEASSGGGGMRIAGIVIGVAGLAAAGAGIYFGVHARSRANEISHNTVWDQALYDGGQRDDRNAKILLGVGGAAMLGGAIVFWLGHRSGTETHVSIAPTNGGASMVWSCEL